MAECGYNISGEQCSENTGTETSRQILREKALNAKSLDPTGVILDIGREEINADKIITQTLEGYILPLLPAVPLQIHNIHLTSEVIEDGTSWYRLLQLPSYEQNTGKHQLLEIDNIPVSYVFYPNGTIDIYTKNNEKPFRLQTEEDRVNLIAFIRRIKDNLPSSIAVPDIEQWEFTECDVNRGQG